MSNPLRLLAEDADDIEVIAALLQDALINLSEVRFNAGEEQFILVANRFRWEAIRAAAPDLPTASATYERVHSGLCFDHVKAVGLLGIDRGNRSGFLEILTITAKPEEIEFIFAGGGRIRLKVEKIRCLIHDLDEPWPTTLRPVHAIDDEGLDG
jgi:hypothetical protein